MISSLKLLKSFLGVDKQTSSEEDDVLLYRILEGADAEVKQYCDRDLEVTTYTDQYYDGDGSSKLLLDDYPVVSVTSLYCDLGRDFDASTLVASSDYKLDSEKGIIELYDGSVFPVGPNTIKITFSAGYSVVPSDIVSAVNKIAAANYLDTKTDVNVIAGESVFYKPDAMRKSAFKTLNRYRRVG